MQRSPPVLTPKIVFVAQQTARKTAATILLFAAFAIATGAQDAGGMGTLAGVVLNAQGKPVSGASVVLQTADGGNPEATTTNSQGRFFFAELTHGYYNVRATHQGWVSIWKHNVEVATGKQTDIRLQLSTQKKP
jgi:ABC-type Fe3+ transport system substrate-binding protein